MKTASFKVIECQGTPRQMGQQYGEQAREEIRANEALRRDTGRQAGASAALKAAHACIIRMLPDVYAEMRGIAEGSGMPLDSLLYEQACAFGCGWPASCTSMAVRTRRHGALLGKNNDGEQDGRFFVIRKSCPRRGLPMIQVTYAGWLSGLDAMNAAGLVNGHNSVGSIFDKSGPKPDIRLYIYHLMRTCRTTAQFLDRLTACPCTGKGYNIVVADRKGETAVVEAAVPLTAVRDRNQDFLYATNHFASDALKDADRRTREAKPISIYRYGYLRWIAETARPQALADLKRVLRSTDPWAPCRHGGPHVSHTLWSMIGLPQTNRLLVASGAPDTVPYRTFSLDDL